MRMILPLQAARALHIIPQYDIDHFSVLQKASKHHAKASQEDIAGRSALARTNWVMPQVMSPELQT